MKRALAIVALAYLAVYILPLGARPLYSPDETRYAEIPREMLASGDWVVPRLDGVRYFEKPPLGYWVTAVSMLAFGENAFAVRLPSALAAGATALIVLLLAHHRYGGRSRAGPLAAVVYLSSFLVFAVGTANMLDSLFTLFLTGALASFFLALAEPRAIARDGLLAAAGLCCGLALLTKGFLALAIPAMVVVGLLGPQRRWRDLLRASCVSSAAALAVALPWTVLIWYREPDFWRYFFWVEHVNRFLRAHGSQHPKPFWYFTLVLLGSQVLWLPLLAAVISGHRRGRPGDPLRRWTLLWAALPFVFLSASQGKLATYVLPCLPPLAILVAAGLCGHVERRRPTLQLSLGAWGSAAVALAGLLFAVTTDWPGYDSSEVGKRALLLGGLACWCAVAATAGLVAQPRRRLWTYCCAPVVLLLCAPWIVPRASAERRALSGLRTVLTDSSTAPPADALVVVDKNTIYAVSWYLKRSDLYVVEDDGGEMSYGLGYRDSRQRLLQPDDLARWLAADSRRRDLFLALMQRNYSRLPGAAVAAARPGTAGGVVWARFASGPEPAPLAAAPGLRDPRDAVARAGGRPAGPRHGIRSQIELPSVE